MKNTRLMDAEKDGARLVVRIGWNTSCIFHLGVAAMVLGLNLRGAMRTVWVSLTNKQRRNLGQFKRGCSRVSAHVKKLISTKFI